MRMPYGEHLDMVCFDAACNIQLVQQPTSLEIASHLIPIKTAAVSAAPGSRT